MLEKTVKDAVRDLLTARGAYWFMPVQTGYGRRSVDFLICYRGNFIAVETKRHGKRATANQENCLFQIALAGGRSAVEDDPDCPKLKKILAEIDDEILVRQGQASALLSRSGV